MDTLGITRSTKFVSLDTHPAINALVLTYDVLAIANDPISGKEVSRASKRHQQLVKISMLDKLGENEDPSQPSKLALDLNGLSAEIIEKCPLLASNPGSARRRTGQSVQDIKLHLLYLINRRQAQGQTQRQTDAIITTQQRPMSSARRLGSTSAMGRRGPSSALSNSMRPMQDSSISSQDMGDVYTWVLNKETPIEFELDSRMQYELMDHFEKVRSERVSIDGRQNDEPQLKMVDSYLDSLYGSRNERGESLIKLQQLFSSDEKLPELADKRLLVCALVRTLADINQSPSSSETMIDGATDHEMVISCLISLTRYRDIYVQAFSERNNIAGVDIISAHLGSLEIFVTRLLQESKKNAKICSNSFHFLATQHLILLDNLIQLDHNRILQIYPTNELFLSLTGMMQLLSAQLGQDLRTMSKSEKLQRSILLLAKTLSLFMKLSSCRDFLNQIRGPKMNNNVKNKQQQQRQKLEQVRRNQPFFDCIINLIGRLQMSRPGSGQATAANSMDEPIVTDNSILNDFYELELLAFKFLSLLMCDRRIKLKLIKQNVLKILLRNLVSLLASRNNLASFNKSCVLTIPLDCLYKLTCEQSVLDELWKSKIILRCLFEYLLSSSSSLQKSLIEHEIVNTNKHMSTPILSPMTEIKLEPECADHYLLSIWCNLTSNVNRLKILDSDPNLQTLLEEYIQSVAKLMGLYCKSQKPATSDDFRMMIYLNLKLIANLSRLSQKQSTSAIYAECEMLIEKLANYTIQMIDQLEILSPLVVETLWTISNLLLISTDNSMAPDLQPCPETLLKLMQRLFTFSQSDFEAETDDDLLLVSCIFMAILAQTREICGFLDSCKSYEMIIRATNFLMTAKSSDKSIVFASLFTLIRLTNHRECRSELDANLSNSNQKNLLPRLSSYMLHQNVDIANLACILTDRFVAISQNSSARFSAYNAKWLQAIQASRDELMTPPHEESDGFNWLADNEDRELLEDAAELGTLSRPTTLSQGSQSIAQLSSALGNEEIMAVDDDFIDDFDNDDEEFDESDNDNTSRLSSEAPDFSVVDPNSMIKHLVTRQKFRTQWSQH